MFFICNSSELCWVCPAAFYMAVPAFFHVTIGLLKQNYFYTALFCFYGLFNVSDLLNFGALLQITLKSKKAYGTHPCFFIMLQKTDSTFVFKHNSLTLINITEVSI